jgi:hypothetical protein
VFSFFFAIVSNLGASSVSKSADIKEEDDDEEAETEEKEEEESATNSFEYQSALVSLEGIPRQNHRWHE